MTTKSAKGLRGILLVENGLPYLRVKANNEDGYEDIEIHYDDLEIELLDDDVVIREKPCHSGTFKCIDYSNQTLGIKEDE
jgi:hypothetical protein